jgi:flagellar assembly factor FliW
MPRIGVVALLILLLLLQPVSNIEFSSLEEVEHSSKNSGIDLSATDVSVRYSNPSDESQYKMFSSNHPILGFERPKNLYVVDTVNSTPMDIEVTVRNDGSTASGIITVNLLILHDEYERFELANRTVTMNSLSANGQGTATFYNVYVNYSGNHSLVVTPSFQGVDDNPSNNNLNRHYTVAK